MNKKNISGIISLIAIAAIISISFGTKQIATTQP
jgi:hypothetical protein